LVGLGGTAESRFEVFRIAREIKAENPSIKVAFGGPQATFTAEDTLTNIPAIDAVVRGEGEETLLEVVTMCSDGLSLEGIPGVSFRQEGKVIHNPPRERIKNLDDLPLPARHLLPMDRYNLNMDFLNVPGETIMTSRGCPYNCSFCSASAMWERMYTKRSAQSVVSEIQHVTDQYGAEGIKFFDSTFTVDRRHVEGICDALRSEKLSHIPWECEVRADTVDKDLLENMKDAGCYLIDLGLESASNRVLEKINKKITVTQAEEVLEYCLDLGIRVRLFLTWGHPGETLEDLEKTLGFVEKWRRRIPELGDPHPIRVYPGTGVESFAHDKGYLPEDFSWAKPCSWKDNEKVDQPSHIPVLPILIEQKEPGYTLRSRVTKSIVSQYSFSYVLRKVSAIRSFSDLIGYVRTLRRRILGIR
jgi:anaerobic magnesium-protoporphyrin IX monomethyl ester cyclase